MPRKRRASGALRRSDYPPNWDAVAYDIKQAADWRCEACGHPHDPETHHVLTVDHCIDPNPYTIESWNLLALCQRCHLIRHGLRPAPITKTEAVRRIRERIAERERPAEYLRATLMKHHPRAQGTRPGPGALEVDIDGSRQIIVWGGLEDMIRQAYRYGWDDARSSETD